MSNLYTGTIQTNGEYVNLAELTGITFTEGTTYAIQLQNMAWLREGTDGKGFLFNRDKGYSWTCKGDDLYIRTESQSVVINIAENSGFFLNKNDGGGSSPINASSKYYLPSNSALISQGNCVFMDNGTMAQTTYADKNNAGILYNFDLDIEAEDEIEIIIKHIYLGGSGDCTFLCLYDDDSNYLVFDTYGGHRIVAVQNNQLSWKNSDTPLLVSGAFYWYKIVLKNNTYTLKYSDDGENWEDQFTETMAGAYTHFKELNLCKAQHGTSLNVKQMVDLTNCAFKKNGQKVIDFIVNAADVKWSLNNIKIYNGTLTSDAVFTGAQTGYMMMSDIMPISTADSWEFRTKYTYNGGDNDQKTIFGYVANQNFLTPLCFVNGANKFYMSVSSTGSSYNIVAAAGDVAISPGQTYYLKIGFSGTEYYVLFNTEGWDSEFTKGFSFASTQKSYIGAPFAFMSRYNTSEGRWWYSAGSMDLKETSFIINNQRVWQALK